MHIFTLFIQTFSATKLLGILISRLLVSTLAGISVLAFTAPANAAVLQYTDYSDFLSTTITSDVGAGISTSGNYTTNATSATNEVPGAVSANSMPMAFSGFSAFEIGMTFGNDQNCCGSNGLFDVTLSILDDVTLLGSVQVATNGNDLTDQFIGLVSDIAFNNVLLEYGAGSGNLSHFIARIDIGYDDVSVGAVPVPAAVWLFGTALIGLIGINKRRSRYTA